MRDGLPRKTLTPDALKLLEAHDWPGNVRELENLMRRVAVLGRDAAIEAGELRGALGDTTSRLTAQTDADLDDAVRSWLRRVARDEPATLDNGTLYDRLISDVERPLIEAMLDRHGNNQLRAAKAMGLNRNTLRKRLDDLGIDPALRAYHADKER